MKDEENESYLHTQSTSFTQQKKPAEAPASFGSHPKVGSLPVNSIICGDNLKVLRTFPESSIDLIVTSPPYADKRKRVYGGVSTDQYVPWFLPIAAELKRVLKPTGTFILNIKESVTNGERDTYVIELILQLRKQGWLWTEEFCWHKRNCYPGKWPNRFRDAWERCLQFNNEKKFAMYQEAVMVPMGDWAKTRLKKLSETDKSRDESKVRSGFGKNVSNWLGKTMVYPTNVLHLATESSNKNHSAVFPSQSVNQLKQSTAPAAVSVSISFQYSDQSYPSRLFTFCVSFLSPF